jgi:hypothetical protein
MTLDGALRCRGSSTSKGLTMAPKNSRARRLVVVGAFAVAAVAAPAYASFAVSDAGSPDRAVAQCLAWFGSRNDGICLSESNGTPAYIGTPQVGLGGGGLGISTAPLLPGQTINAPIG